MKDRGGKKENEIEKNGGGGRGCSKGRINGLTEK